MAGSGMEDPLGAGDSSRLSAFSSKSTPRKSHVRTSCNFVSAEARYISDEFSTNEQSMIISLDAQSGGGFAEIYEEPCVLWTFPWIVLSQQDSIVVRNHARMLSPDDS